LFYFVRLVVLEGETEVASHPLRAEEAPLFLVGLGLPSILLALRFSVVIVWYCCYFEAEVSFLQSVQPPPEVTPPVRKS
jgi:hypothetical protein